jgi:hypothetical protein
MLGAARGRDHFRRIPLLRSKSPDFAS